MPAKRPKAQNGVTGERKISSFFKPDGMPLEIAGKKRIREEGPFSESVQEDYLSPPPSKKSPSSSPPNGSENEVSPEQKLRMERNRLEAEARVIAKKFGAEKLGLTWVKALLVEFKKPYMQEQKMSFLGPQPVQLMKFEESENEIWEHNFHCSSIVQAQDPGNDTDAIFKVKVVILGQDPYHGPNQAHGLCFSVRVGVSIPPSLQNMYKELSSDIEGFKLPDHGYLMGWAKQGVLLLNACLTVRAREANSHAGKGWENVTDAVIHWLNDRTAGLVFLLWGSHAQKKGSFINKKKHCVLKSPHPSPLSAHRGFLGCKHFSQTNTYLRQQGKKHIDWSYLPKTMDD